MTIEEQHQQIAELQDQLQTAEDAHLRAEVNIVAFKQEIDRLKQMVHTVDDERVEKLTQRLKSSELELEQLQQSKQLLIQQREKLELELNNLRLDNEDFNQKKEQTQRTTRRIQVRKINCFLLIDFQSSI